MESDKRLGTKYSKLTKVKGQVITTPPSNRIPTMEADEIEVLSSEHKETGCLRRLLSQLACFWTPDDETLLGTSDVYNTTTELRSFNKSP
jgi:hypothetical protein